MSCFICKFQRKFLRGMIFPVWSKFTCKQCLCTLYVVTSVSGIIRIGLLVYVILSHFGQSSGGGFNISAWRKCNCKWRYVSRNFRDFCESLVACYIYGSGCKAAYVSAVTSPQRLQRRHSLLNARDQIWRTLRTGQVTQLALSRWNTVRSSVREGGVNGGFFPTPLLVQSPAASQYRACVWKWLSNSVTTEPKTKLALPCFVCEHLRYLAELRSCRISTLKTDAT